MNWDALQAVGELVAAAGVVVSLVYLAAQVRQNTRSIQSAANQELVASFNAALDFPKYSEYGGRLYRSTLYGSWSDLSADEQAAARISLIQVLRVFEQAYLQRQAGLLADDVWEGWAHTMRMVMGFPGCVQGWVAIRPMLNAEFASWMDGLAESGPQAVREYADAWDEVGMVLSPSDSADAAETT